MLFLSLFLKETKGKVDPNDPLPAFFFFRVCFHHGEHMFKLVVGYCVSSIT